MNNLNLLERLATELQAKKHEAWRLEAIQFGAFFDKHGADAHRARGQAFEEAEKLVFRLMAEAAAPVIAPHPDDCAECENCGYLFPLEDLKRGINDQRLCVDCYEREPEDYQEESDLSDYYRNGRNY